ncbi:MAG: hypothetical protein AAF384_00275 [Pseudomonadota bacterium]
MSSVADAFQALAQATSHLRVDELDENQFFERWLKHDTWPVEDSLPMLLAIEPERWNRENVSSNAFAIEVQSQIREFMSGSAEVAPLQVVRWAQTQAIQISPILSGLADFIGRVLHQGGLAATSADLEAPGNDDRERILGAALAVVTKSPSNCKDDNGFFDGQRIVGEILAKAVLWFPTGRPSLSDEEMADLIESWLR